MKRTRFALSAVAAIGMGLAGVARAENPAKASTDNKAPTDNQESLEVRFAKAKLLLAELGLKRAEQLNARVAETIPASVVAEYRRDIEVEQARLKAVTAGKADADFDYWLTQVRAKSQEAQAGFERARTANKTAVGAVDQIDVERMRVRAEIFQLLYEQGQQVVSKSLTDRIGWQNNVLLTEVEMLNGEVFRNRMMSGDHD